MAFIRDYGMQNAGDPFRRVIRSGRLVRRVPVAQLLARGGRGRAFTSHRLALAAGDPFRFKLPKFVRKLSLKKVVSGVGKLAKAALPLAAGLIPGVGAFAAPLLGGLLGGGGEPPTPEPVFEAPPRVGTVGEVSRELDTQDVEAEELYGPDDEDEDEDFDELEDEDLGYLEEFS